MGLFCYTWYMARRPLYEKEQLRNGTRTVDQTRSERDQGYGALRDYNKGHEVRVFWDFNAKATEDGLVGIKIGKEVAFLDVNQLQKFLRWV